MADKGLTIEQFNAMGNSQLSKELGKTKAGLFNLCFTQAIGNLEDHGHMRTVYRSITRTYAIACERELDYHTTSSTEK